MLLLSSITKPPPLLLLLPLIFVVMAQEDSLQSALNAVNRRQRDLTQIPMEYKNFYYDKTLGPYYGSDDKDTLAFLKPARDRSDRKAFERELLNYLENEDGSELEQFVKDEEPKKPFSSSFRERIENDKAKQKQELEEAMFSKLNNRPKNNNVDTDEFIEMFSELPQKYSNKYSETSENSVDSYPSGGVSKRLFSEYVPNLRYNSVGMKKRNRYFQPDDPNNPLYLIDYSPRDEVYDKMEDSNVADYYNNLDEQSKKPDLTYLKLYGLKNMFPVTKRSNPPIHHKTTMSQFKHSSNRIVRKTDPEVAKELSDVFGTEKPKSELDDKPKKKNEQLVRPKKAYDETNLKKSTLSEKSKGVINKEQVPDSPNEEPLQIQKKSIDWSDYFGYDRKKKYDGNVDNEWLMERYHKAIAVGAKRDAEYPLQNFKHHDEIKQENGKVGDTKDNLHFEEAKIGVMDKKLRNIEDSIVDEALKYTGAHEKATNSKEMRKTKDNIISRLAAAYSLEKIRQALGEYKHSIEKQKRELRDDDKPNDDFVTEEKRISVPRKEAVDEDNENIDEIDNHIKCAQEDEECEEQTYKTPKEILNQESLWSTGKCDKIQRACNEMIYSIPDYAHILIPACYLHQACLLCGADNWYVPIRQCNTFYLAKANFVCEGNKGCEKSARRSVSNLLEVNRFLREDTSEDCDLACPDTKP